MEQIEVVSPIKGQVIRMENMKDDAFASGVLGRGVAILPEEGKVYAPADAVVSAIFPTLHAIGLKTKEGMEILIHVGLDTVQLEGKGFEAKIKQGDTVKQGQLLLKFDKDFIEKQGFSLETPVLISNADDYLEIVETNAKRVNVGESLLTVLN